jgi:hypothetical protein
MIKSPEHGMNPEMIFKNVEREERRAPHHVARERAIFEKEEQSKAKQSKAKQSKAKPRTWARRVLFLENAQIFECVMKKTTRLGSGEVFIHLGDALTQT